MEAKKLALVRTVVSEAVSQLDEQEKAVVLQWAKESREVVTQSSLTKKEKFARLREISSAKPVVVVLKAVARLLKSKAWDNQSWARRLGIAGLAAGVASFGLEGAGIVALGGGIGVPLALLSTAGATFLGVVIDELKKEVNERKSK